mmetsp:Transcript_23180/g.39659  ORF Transcript_23180/g.39659 Transcript_23180/m.39659 type:complete len:125 (+) Transcript_23180:1703-2077(+)
MEKKDFGKRYPGVLRARAVLMVLGHESEKRSRSGAISSVEQKVGCSRDSLRIWIKQHDTDSGIRGGLTNAERDRIKELERENRQLRQANEILKKTSAYFAPPIGTSLRDTLSGSGTELDRPFRK